MAARLYYFWAQVLPALSMLCACVCMRFAGVCFGACAGVGVGGVGVARRAQGQGQGEGCPGLHGGAVTALHSLLRVTVCAASAQRDEDTQVRVTDTQPPSETTELRLLIFTRASQSSSVKTACELRRVLATSFWSSAPSS